MYLSETVLGPARALGCWTLAAALLLGSGCQQRAEITRYTVEKPPPLDPLPHDHPPLADPASAVPPSGPPTDRTLGAIVPLEPQGWFFKLTGPADAVAARESDFLAFLRSVRFSAEGPPSWTLPAGWEQRPGNQIRFATLVITGPEPLEVSVTALPNAGSSAAEYVLVNVNRWRGQLKLPPISAEQLPSETMPLEMNGAQGSFVNLAGHAAPDSMGRPPFFSGAGDGN